MLNYSKCKLVKTEFLNDSIYSIYLEKPVNSIFVPGQFYMIKSSSFIDKLPRSYSVSSTNQDELLRFSIKITGRFTQALSELEKGFELELYGPMGKFAIKLEAKSGLLVAGGIGVAPFLSMIRENFQLKNKNLLLLYSCRTKEDSVFSSELSSLEFENENSSNKFISYYSQEDLRISKEELLKHLKFDEFLSCGPDSLMNFCTSTWAEQGIPKTSIRTETFGLPSKKIN